MTDSKATSWIETFSGKKFWPLEPEAEHVRLEDLAHALATTNRFGGHALDPISVAQHCLAVADLAYPALRLAALLHDAEEAYLGDHVRPVKGRMFYLVPGDDGDELVSASDMGEHVRHCIFDRFDVPWPEKGEWEHLESLDLRMLAAEGRDQMRSRTEGWAPLPPAPKKSVVPLPWRRAETRWHFAFMSAHLEMKGYA